MQLLATILSVDSRMLPQIQEFYHKRLGMALTMQGNRISFSFPNAQSSTLEFLVQTDKRPFRNDPSKDVYWKIGLALQDVDIGRQQLLRQNIAVTPPRQFQEIGYLCHLRDPMGYSLELLQEDFECNVRRLSPIPDYPLGQPSTIGQITLRVRDIQRSLQFYQQVLGMKLLSRQRVGTSFTLYFLAFTNETPPNADIDAVGNREWLWKRPYTTLELMHDASQTTYTLPPSDTLGFQGISIAVEHHEWDSIIQHCRELCPESIQSIDEPFMLSLADPDQVPITLLCRTE